MFNFSALRQCFNVVVVGSPPWRANYLAEGLCRLKWLVLAALTLFLVQGYALATWSPQLFFAATRRFGVDSPTYIISACLFPAVLASIFIFVQSGRISISQAQTAVALMALAIAVSQALLLGMSKVNPERIASFDLTLLTIFAVAPLTTRSAVVVAAVAITIVFGTVFSVEPEHPMHASWILHFASFAAIGMVFARWQLATFRTQWMSHIKLARRARQLEANKRRIEQLVDQLTDANTAKTQFLAAASHDLRQPMHAIGMLVGALRRYISFPEVKTIVEKIESSVEAMDNLFNTLLDISKLDAGIVTAKPTEFPIGTLFAELDLQYGAYATQKGISLRVMRSTALVISDPTLLRRILINLVSNAIRYTEHGRILIGCKRIGNSRVRLLVCDTGCGIPEDQQHTVFSEFVQLQNPTRDRSKGLGLGLAIVRRTAELLGHQITIKSVVGRGSLFGITVPLSRYDKRVAQTTYGDTANELDGAFILVVDDEQDILFSMNVLLEKYGCKVLCAQSGEEAVLKLEQHLRAPDLIITDYRLRQDETGLDVIELVRQTQASDIPALIVTGSHSADDLNHATSSGYPVLFKPLTEKQLLAKVSQLLQLASIR